MRAAWAYESAYASTLALSLRQCCNTLLRWHSASVYSSFCALRYKSTTSWQALHDALHSVHSSTTTTSHPFKLRVLHCSLFTTWHACATAHTLPVTASIQFSNFKSLCMTFLWCMKATALSISVSIAIIAGSLAQRPGVAVVDVVIQYWCDMRMKVCTLALVSFAAVVVCTAVTSTSLAAMRILGTLHSALLRISSKALLC